MRLELKRMERTAWVTNSGAPRPASASSGSAEISDSDNGHLLSDEKLSRAHDLVIKLRLLAEIIKSLDACQCVAKVNIGERHYNMLRAEAQGIAMKSGRTSQSVVLVRLTDKLIDDLRKKAGEMVERISDRYSEPGLTFYEKQKANDADRRDLCWHLNEIKKNNNGILPADLQADWDGQLCSTYEFS